MFVLPAILKITIFRSNLHLILFTVYLFMDDSSIPFLIKHPTNQLKQTGFRSARAHGQRLCILYSELWRINNDPVISTELKCRGKGWELNRFSPFQNLLAKRSWKQRCMPSMQVRGSPKLLHLIINGPRRSVLSSTAIHSITQKSTCL